MIPEGMGRMEGSESGRVRERGREGGRVTMEGCAALYFTWTQERLKRHQDETCRSQAWDRVDLAVASAQVGRSENARTAGN